MFTCYRPRRQGQGSCRAHPPPGFPPLDSPFRAPPRTTQVQGTCFVLNCIPRGGHPSDASHFRTSRLRLAGVSRLGGARDDHGPRSSHSAAIHGGFGVTTLAPGFTLSQAAQVGRRMRRLERKMKRIFDAETLPVAELRDRWMPLGRAPTSRGVEVGM